MLGAIDYRAITAHRTGFHTLENTFYINSSHQHIVKLCQGTFVQSMEQSKLHYTRNVAFTPFIRSIVPPTTVAK